jgi:hypothetical protein
MNSKKVVAPVKTGVQIIYNYMKMLDSGFRRNDGKTKIQTFGVIIIIDVLMDNKEKEVTLCRK